MVSPAFTSVVLSLNCMEIFLLLRLDHCPIHSILSFSPSSHRSVRLIPDCHRIIVVIITVVSLLSPSSSCSPSLLVVVGVLFFSSLSLQSSILDHAIGLLPFVSRFLSFLSFFLFSFFLSFFVFSCCSLLVFVVIVIIFSSASPPPYSPSPCSSFWFSTSSSAFAADCVSRFPRILYYDDEVSSSSSTSSSSSSSSCSCSCSCSSSALHHVFSSQP